MSRLSINIAVSKQSRSWHLSWPFHYYDNSLIPGDVKQHVAFAYSDVSLRLKSVVNQAAMSSKSLSSVPLRIRRSTTKQFYEFDRETNAEKAQKLGEIEELRLLFEDKGTEMSPKMSPEDMLQKKEDPETP